MAATSYPTVMRSAGAGWTLAMGRFGQVCSPLVIGALLTMNMSPGRILTIMALAPVLGGVCALLKAMLSREQAGALTDAPGAAEKTA